MKLLAYLARIQQMLTGKKTSLLSLAIAGYVVYNDINSFGYMTEQTIAILGALGLWNAGAAKIDRQNQAQGLQHPVLKRPEKLRRGK